ncbi:histidinol dehydrogenase [Streptomyces sp. 110]|uniref:Histidinol dehydrogenase n=1 Tax=Streptomyces endocoffeicus TaxID=2898945 RepID=A0ABS1PER3_9ACTN|nr:histidinol dehydrogenase [Streptomyces endocoffeicus]MBL1110863.1 histidinol dehydrogenase [Streptomyces endocoffeicus]
MSSTSKIVKGPLAVEASRTSRPEIVATVAEVIADVRQNGDAAVRRWSQKFDGWSPESFQLSPDQVASVVSSVPETVLDDLRFVQRQVRGFAQAQRDSLNDFEVETLPGVYLGQRNIPIGAAGAYVPGGRYPLTASAHMTVLTAKVAGVGRVAATTPPDRGTPPPVSIAAMHLAGADEIYVMGGVQAVAALALGTETIAAVDMLAGPGNAYVAEAKRQLFGEVGIDLFAGPTEVLIVADETADPLVVATDLLSQAEHGPDSPAVLITTSHEVATRTIAYVEELLPGLSTGEIAGRAWRDRGEVIVVPSLDAAYELADEYASEHVQILTAEPREALHRMRNYGALFLGDKTCVAYGDKVIGTNHVLPTMGAARYTGGLWVGKYLKTVTYQEIQNAASSAELGEICGRASRIENFEGHARSGDVRSARYGSARPAWTDHAFGRA